MRKWLVGVALLLTGLAVAVQRGGMTVIYAQTLPATVHAHWNPNAATDNVTQYNVSLDGGPSITVLPSACTPTDCSTAISVPAFGNHTVSATAQNLLLSTDPTSIQVSAPATATFVLAAAPKPPANTAVTK